MGLATTSKVMASGVAVYVIMAACSAQEPTTTPRTTLGSGGGAGVGGGTDTGGVGGAGPAGSGGAGVDREAGSDRVGGTDSPVASDGQPTDRANTRDSSLMDALLEPVSIADAQIPPTIADEPCNKSFDSGGFTYLYAEHAFAGKVVNDLARVVAFAHQVDPNWPGAALPAGYAWKSIPPAIRDGYAMAVCLIRSGGEAASPYDSVRFILP